MGSLLASVLPVPSKVTTAPATTLCATPALATGAELELEATTVTDTMVLSTLPSFTTKPKVKMPTKSAVKVGLGEVVELSTAALRVGLPNRVHL